MLNPELTEQIQGATDILRRGGVVAFPTETVYGLGADAANPDAVRRVFEIKGRPADHPLIVHIGHISGLDVWAQKVPDADAWQAVNDRLRRAATLNYPVQTQSKESLYEKVA